MAATNNIVEEWTQVLNTATVNLEQIDAQITRLNVEFTPIRAELVAAQFSVDDVKAAIARSTDSADIAYFTQLLAKQEKRLEAAKQAASIKLAQLSATNKDRELYQSQINEANTQLAKQAKGTTSQNTSTVSATTVPASPAPGNAITTSNTTTSQLPSASSTITVDPSKLSGASLNDNQSISIDQKKISKTEFDNTQSSTVISDPDKLPELGENVEGVGTTGPNGEVMPDSTGEDIVVEGVPEANTEATAQDQAAYSGYQDWRVRLALGVGANFLYNARNPGILAPLSTQGGTDGVVFPYTPSIQVTYAANYEQVGLVHSNYTVQQYNRSSVDSVTITAEFTAQDAKEANYLLAVIHFFRSVTKMFYGQDASPIAGTPPPLCFIYGMGTYQFAGQPLGVNSFTYNLPSDVDYIKTVANTVAGVPTANDLGYCAAPDSANRLGFDIDAGGKLPPPKFRGLDNLIVTYVPTKIQMVIGCVPIMSRNQVSNAFSLEGYANGTLYDGTRRNGGGFW